MSNLTSLDAWALFLWSGGRMVMMGATGWGPTFTTMTLIVGLDTVNTELGDNTTQKLYVQRHYNNGSVTYTKAVWMSLSNNTVKGRRRATSAWSPSTDFIK